MTCDREQVKRHTCTGGVFSHWASQHSNDQEPPGMSSLDPHHRLRPVCCFKQNGTVTRPTDENVAFFICIGSGTLGSVLHKREEP